MRNEQRRDDARNLMWIAGSALVGLIFTGRMVSGDDHEVRYMRRVEIDHDVRVLRHVEGVPTPLTGNGRLYGRVATRDGHEYTGFLRWDRNEGSWADLLDANKEGESRRSGIRFGHVQRIDVDGRSRALLTLRSGEQTEMSSRSSDLGTALRALTIQIPESRSVELGWRDISSVEFFDAPVDVLPAESRLHGTLTTADGRSFTGYIAWDVDEIYSTDLLEGDDAHGDRVALSFGSIQAISRNDRQSARIVLNTGGEMILSGTNDVDGSIRGITVSDPDLGEVKVGWDGFGDVRFHEPDAATGETLYDGGRRLRGTVVTRSGEEISGDIEWDNDESYSWEILHGDEAGVEMQVELGQVARIVRDGRGVAVHLLDGRTLQLTGSNDVDSSNGGIVIEDELGAHRLDWSDFVEVRFER